MSTFNITPEMEAKSVAGMVTMQMPNTVNVIMGIFGAICNLLILITIAKSPTLRKKGQLGYAFLAVNELIYSLVTIESNSYRVVVAMLKIPTIMTAKSCMLFYLHIVA